VLGGAPYYESGVFVLPLEGPRVWARLATQGVSPAPRIGHSSIYDPIRDRLILCGGAPAGGQAERRVWTLDLAGTPTWSELSLSGGPGARRDHSAIYDPVRDQMVVFGGADSSAHGMPMSGPCP